MIMEVIEYTKNGEQKRTLTTKEVQECAALGNPTALKEVLLKDLSKATSLQEEVDAIKKYLGV